ncbi:Bifunctional inhibitor/plant lipid transfer protein/seed storage helical domain containing protein [Parasponia andersonii]|uniref:Bifunctional inhibitor/plant lipid transfer protein/seed storage helical domain containing protein n=1 Tax=Parasponia andersonii TaxID=3476 RepID=A0A2P5AQ92_PARAD|nr:Bifunctional inhibitor/plant lipid transfer protein/seed storage helical domain containing protein [Parasponia andersonii]
MAWNGDKVVVQWILLAICLIALLGRGSAITLCNIDSKQLTVCLPALSGKSLDENCCALVHQANLPCLCKYKAALPAFGFDPERAMELPQKCGLKTPLECHGKVPKSS